MGEDVKILLGGWVFREKVTRAQLAGIVIALGGLLSIIFVADGSVSTLGLLLVLLGAFAWSVTNIIIKKARTTQVFAFLVWSSAFAPIPLFLLDYLINGTQGYTTLVNLIDMRTVVSILFQVYPNTLFAYWVWNSLLRQYPVSTVAPLSLLVPIFGMFGSMVMFGESLSPMKIVAVTLIVSGLAVGLYGGRLADLHSAWRQKDSSCRTHGKHSD